MDQGKFDNLLKHNIVNKGGLNIFYTNLNAISNKVSELSLCHDIYIYGCKIICLTETHLTPSESDG